MLRMASDTASMRKHRCYCLTLESINNLKMNHRSFAMLGPLRQYLPHILVAVALVSIFGASYASVMATSSSNNPPKALWSPSSVTISFTHGGTGSFGESFKCAPPYLNKIVFVATTNNAAVSLTTNPSTFSACGPSFTTFTLTAHSALATRATGRVTIYEKTPYGTQILPSLTVNIVAT